ncbi:hypothetical protein PS928_05014 [Pseudomonas fluorescens]|uniref:Uncharacterized protein n=1 Tax=Pseudomonas fluorescens TaxID=294 RepID=A0A5E7VER9_PSEFL|nr:hypothetical protein PS928_05014 [Pseudomonas fluorescens]
MHTSQRRVRATRQSTRQRQINIAFEAVELRRLSQAQRTKILTHLIALLIQAATGAIKGSDEETDCLLATVLKRKAVVYVRQSTQVQI